MSEELELFRENVRRFVQEEVAPNYLQWEKDGIFPRHLWSKLGEQGLLAVDIPEEYEGAGADFLFSMIKLFSVDEFSDNAVLKSGTIVLK